METVERKLKFHTKNIPGNFERKSTRKMAHDKGNRLCCLQGLRHSSVCVFLAACRCQYGGQCQNLEAFYGILNLLKLSCDFGIGDHIRTTERNANVLLSACKDICF